MRDDPPCKANDGGEHEKGDAKLRNVEQGERPATDAHADAV